MVVDKVIETIEKHRLIEKNDSIIVALSGGPDSIFLLHILNTLKDSYNLKIYAVHLNHQIRGLDAHLDALYTSNFCEELGIPCFIRSIDVPAYCKEKGLGIEDGARVLRYQLFEDVRKKVDANKIAIGHNKNDQAETILMRMMRGSGLKGLCGIDYIRDSRIIRPILDISRNEIEDYCKQMGLHPKIDKTNLEDIYSRNKIRLKILPYMRDEFNENIVDTIVRMGLSIRDDLDYIESQVDVNYETCVKSYNNAVYVFVEAFSPLHQSIKNRIIIRSIKNLVGQANSLGKKHIESILALEANDKIDKMLDLPNGLHAYRYRDYIYLSKEKVYINNSEFEYKLSLKGKNEGKLYIDEISKHFKYRVIDVDEFNFSKIGSSKQYIDLDKLPENIKLRNRRQGDRIRLSGGSKKIKNLFTDLKIANEEKSSIILLISDEEVACVCGYRVGIDYKVDDNTKNILEFIIE